MIFAIALSSNLNPQQHFQLAYRTLQQWGDVEFSDIFQIPCRDGIGADYWNSACLLNSHYSFEWVERALKQLESHAGRVRPSHHISLDVDVIAWGECLEQMSFNPKKLPLPLDVKIPLSQLWQHDGLQGNFPTFPIVNLEHL